MTNKNDEPPPEGPECRRVAEGLIEISKGKTVKQFEVIGGRFIKKPPTGLNLIKDKPVIIGGGVKGKFIWLELSDNMSLWITLGMSGKWSTQNQPHAHFAIHFEDGISLYFVDQRRFGTLRFKPLSKLPKKLASLGVDLLNSEASVDEFKQVVRKQNKKTIVEALMNQAVCAGVGNYIKCEVLYRAELDPEIEVYNVTDSKLEQLYELIKLIIRASYRQGGASIRNYRQVNGEFGNFVFEFQVYAQRMDPLGNRVERLDTSDGRTTHWVPCIQSRYKYLNQVNGE